MITIDNLRNNIIDKLLTISNQEYLEAIYKIVENSSTDQSTVQLTDEQMLMLQLSDDDIENGRLINQTEVDQQDLKWLKGL
jgi:predicted DNA binding protein